jgi:hypothetical protein
VTFANVFTGHAEHAVAPVEPENEPGAHSEHAVTGKVHSLEKLPAAHAAHEPRFDCPGAHGQLSALAHVSVVALLKACAAVGIAGQLYTSFLQMVSELRPIHWPARYPPPPP